MEQCPNPCSAGCALFLLCILQIFLYHWGKRKDSLLPHRLPHWAQYPKLQVTQITTELHCNPYPSLLYTPPSPAEEMGPNPTPHTKAQVYTPLNLSSLNIRGLNTPEKRSYSPHYKNLKHILHLSRKHISGQMPSLNYTTNDFRQYTTRPIMTPNQRGVHSNI